MNVYKPKMKNSTWRGNPVPDYGPAWKVGKLWKKCLGWMDSHSGLALFSCGPNAYRYCCHWVQEWMAAEQPCESEMWPIQAGKRWVWWGLDGIPPLLSAPSRIPLSNPLMAPYHRYMETSPESICTLSLLCPWGVEKHPTTWACCIK